MILKLLFKQLWVFFFSEFRFCFKWLDKPCSGGLKVLKGASFLQFEKQMHLSIVKANAKAD